MEIRCNADQLKSFGKNMKTLRLSRSLSQNKFAEMTNISRSMVALYESGKRNPPLTTAIEIAKAFGIKVDDLWKGSSVSLANPYKEAISVAGLCERDRTIILNLVREMRRTT